jgi:hypothetical protein
METRKQPTTNTNTKLKPFKSNIRYQVKTMITGALSSTVASMVTGALSSIVTSFSLLPNSYPPPIL